MYGNDRCIFMSEVPPSLKDLKNSIDLPRLGLSLVIATSLLIGLSACKDDDRYNKGRPGGLVIQKKSPTPTPSETPKEQSYLPTEALNSPELV